jgi:hypothetical protein
MSYQCQDKWNENYIIKKKLFNENKLITLHCQVFELLNSSIYYKTDIFILDFTIFIRQ